VCVSPVYDVAPLSGLLGESACVRERSECVRVRVRVCVLCMDIQTHMLYKHILLCMQGVGFYQSSLGGSRVTTPGFMSPLARD
jgi:hypothetical protein